MSYGVVVCSHCHREVHQARDREQRLYWYHCQDRTRLCQDAQAAHAKSKSLIVGPACMADDYGNELPE